MKTRWILAAIGSLWVCLASAQDSITRHKPQFKFSISAGTSYEFWTLDKKSSYTRQMQQEVGMKVKFRSGVGFNLGGQFTIKYGQHWLSKAELQLQQTRNSMNITFDTIYDYQVKHIDVVHYRINTTLLPVGYTTIYKGLSFTGAIGVGISHLAGLSGVSSMGGYKGGYPLALYDFWKHQRSLFFYVTQLQAGYKRWHIAANMNWQMQLPNDEHYFKVESEKNGQCAFNYRVLDIRIGCQF